MFCFPPFVLSFFSPDREAWTQLFAFPFFLRCVCTCSLEALRASAESSAGAGCLGMRMLPLLSMARLPSPPARCQRGCRRLLVHFFFSSVLASGVCF